MDHSTIRERAANIAGVAAVLSDELANLNVPEPSFQNGLPPPLHSDAPESKAGTSRVELLQQLDELRALLTEPTLLLTPELVKKKILNFPPPSPLCPLLSFTPFFFFFTCLYAMHVFLTSNQLIFCPFFLIYIFFSLTSAIR